MKTKKSRPMSKRPMSATWAMGIAPVPAPCAVRLAILASVPAAWALIAHAVPAALRMAGIL